MKRPTTLPDRFAALEAEFAAFKAKAKEKDEDAEEEYEEEDEDDGNDKKGKKKSKEKEKDEGDGDEGDNDDRPSTKEKASTAQFGQNFTVSHDGSIVHFSSKKMKADTAMADAIVAAGKRRRGEKD